jgi:hypothetical protein
VQALDRATIIAAFQRLSDLLGQQGLRGEVCLLGGAVMVLAYGARPRTKAVDAVFHPPQTIRALARVVQEEMSLPEAWLNDGAKAFVSAQATLTTEDLPQFEHLRVTAPTAEYLLAMKCLASRTGMGVDDTGDVADIRFLVRRLALPSPQAVLELVGRYYPASQIPVRAQFLLEEVFSGIHKSS